MRLLGGVDPEVRLNSPVKGDGAAFVVDAAKILVGLPPERESLFLLD